MIREAIKQLTTKKDLTFEVAKEVMEEIMSNQATAIQMSAYLTALSMKGESVDEITGSAKGMREQCVKLLHDKKVLEIVGTGGDGAHTFNISTISAIVASAAGIPVAKHGNRAATSKCGAADVLEALGVDIRITPEESLELLNSIGFCFLFAQNYHLAMKYVAPVRKELGIRTIFNILGPLTNPAGASMQLLGVYEEALVEPLARVLYNLGLTQAMVVYGQDGMDEISLSAPTTVCEVSKGEFLSYVMMPEEFGFSRCKKEDLLGGDASTNASIARAILEGELGPKRDAILLNAGAAIHVARPELSIQAAIEVARNTIDSGLAKKQLEQFIHLSNQKRGC